MNRVTRGMVVFAAALTALSCKGDPTDSLRNGVDHLVATPSALYVDNNTTKTVIVEAVDEQGNRQAGNFQIVSVGAGITVVPDDSFNLITNSKGEQVLPSPWTRARFKVTTNVYTESQFVVSAGGEQITIPVRTSPGTLVSAISNLTPGNGDTVTISAPAGLSFDPLTSAVTFGPFAAVVITRTDSTISFVPPPGGSGPATVTNVLLDYAPAAGAFSVPTASSFQVALLPNITSTPTTAQVGDTITINIPAPFKWTARSHILIPGASAIVVTGVSVDSSTVTFRIGPNADTTITVDSTVVSGVPTLGRYALSTTTKLQSPLAATFPATLSNALPAAHDTVVITAGAGFKFLPTATLTVNGNSVFILSRAADSSAITFIPLPFGGLAGPVITNGIVFSTATTLPLLLPAGVNLKLPGSIGGGSIAGAAQLVVPPNGQTSMFVDQGGFVASADCHVGVHCRFYRIDLAAPRTFTVSLAWGNTADLGGYFTDAAGNDIFGDFACDNFGSGAGGQPEACTQTLPAGTTYFVVGDFTATPQNTGSLRITITGQ